MSRCEIEIKLAGVPLEVEFDYQAEQPETPDCPATPEQYEIIAVREQGAEHNLVPLLDMAAGDGWDWEDRVIAQLEQARAASRESDAYDAEGDTYFIPVT